MLAIGLTGETVQILGALAVVAPAHLADELVAGRKKSDADERDQEREPARHAPLGEDDADVLDVPVEEHLPSIQRERSYGSRKVDRYASRTFILHIESPPMSMPPSP